MKKMGEQGSAVIVGGAGNLGRAVVRAFAEAGFQVAVLDRCGPPRGAKPPRGVVYHKTDLLWDESLLASLALAGAAGPLDALVFLQRYRGEGDAWAGELETSLTLTRKIVEQSVKRFRPEGGAIVMAGSVAGSFVADEQPAGYHAAKAGLRQLARYFAVSLGPRGIRCNTVSPAVFIGEGAAKQDRERFARLHEVIPLGRVPTTDEVARVILFLCSPDSSAVTGQDIVVDGGLSLLAHASLVHRLTES